MAPSTPPEDGNADERTVRAAEAALGLVAPDATSGLPPDPGLDAAIAEWERDFASLADALPPVPPRPAVWAAINAAIAPRPAVRRLPIAANLNLWRGLAAAGFAAAALAWLQPWPGPAKAPDVPPVAAVPARPLLVSTLRDRDGAPLYVATYDPARTTFIIVPVASAPPPDRTARVWLVANGQPPAALASLDPGSVTKVEWTAASAVADVRSTLVVTLEPSSQPLQSPSDGIVVAHGRFIAY